MVRADSHGDWSNLSPLVNLVPSVIGPVGGASWGKPIAGDSVVFWQGPAFTEAMAYVNHCKRPQASTTSGGFNLYVGLPWATWIDIQHHKAGRADQILEIRQQLRLVKDQIEYVRSSVTALGMYLKVHTVCQHIFWREYLDEWVSLGVTDLWLSHCTDDLNGNTQLNISIHPWHLFAVNVETSKRRRGLIRGVNSADRRLLASFTGAHMPFYLTDIRPRLLELNDYPDIEVTLQSTWFFQMDVYRDQIGLNITGDSSSTGEDQIFTYNDQLSHSKFALCPSGSGPNTIRFWEALAVGAVPVVLGVRPAFLTTDLVDISMWENSYIYIETFEPSEVFRLLSSIPIDVIERMRLLGMIIYREISTALCH